MSVRAYRVNSKVLEDSPTFNLWHDDEILDFLASQEDVNSKWTEQDGGEFELPVKALKALLKTKLLDKEQKEAVENDIKYAQKQKDDYVLYDSF